MVVDVEGDDVTKRKTKGVMKQNVHWYSRRETVEPRRAAEPKTKRYEWNVGRRSK